MTTTDDTDVADAEGRAAAASGAAASGAARGGGATRLTEIGAPELVDRERHTTAAIVGGVLLMVVIVLAALGLGSLIEGDEQGAEVGEVVLPRFATRPMTEAQQELERMGLVVDIRFEPNEILAPDVVVDQEPIAGARVEVGEQVVLIVSDGPMGVTVPDLTGAEALEAARTLSVLGVELTVEEVHHEEVPMNEIVRSQPAAGARIAIGGTVAVEVSVGPEPRTVPAVVGRPLHEAFAAIGRAELEIAGVTERKVAGAQVGTVLSIDPQPGTEVPRDQPVEVVVGIEQGSQEVPDVVGLTTDSAVAALSGDGLRATVRTEAVPPGDRRVGRVIRQTPIVGSPIERRESVTIYVGQAVAPTTTAPPGGGPPAPGGEPPN